MTDIEIFGFAPSTYTRTARMACHEKGVGHALRPLAFREATHRALHPFLRMPALRHGETVLFETLAIGVYVDAAFAGPALRPEAPDARARMFGWITAQIDYLYPALVHSLPADDGPAAGAMETARERLQPFDAALATDPWLAGDALSLADLFLAPMIAFAGGHPQGASWLDGFAALADWRARIADRPSFVETQP